MAKITVELVRKVRIELEDPELIDNGVGTSIWVHTLEFTWYLDDPEWRDACTGEGHGWQRRLDGSMNTKPGKIYALRLSDLPSDVLAEVEAALTEENQ